MLLTAYPMSVSAVVTSAIDGRPPGEPKTTLTNAATAKPMRMPPSTSDGKPAPRYSAARLTSRMTRAKIRRTGRTRYGDSPNASAVMMATLTTGKDGPSPMRTLTPRPLMSWAPSSSLSPAPMPHAIAAASAPCHAARSCRLTSSTRLTARAAQIEPNA